MSCVKCNCEIKIKKDSLVCTVCSRQFHASCVRHTVRPATRSGAATPWRCEDCSADGSSHNEQEPVKLMEMLKTIRGEMALDRTSNTTNFENLNINIGRVHESIQDLNNKITVVEKEHSLMKTDIEELQKENSHLSRRVAELEGRMNDMDQYSRICNLEIKGVPSTNGENIMAILEKLAGALNIVFNPDDISICHRLPAPRDTRFHPAIVVQFTSRTKRASWLAAAKSKKVTTQDLAANFRPGAVFINEHLTGYNKMVLGRARRLLKSGQLAYVWSKEGKLFVRKTQSSPVVRVWCIADVEHVAVTVEASGTGGAGGGGGGGRGGGGGDRVTMTPVPEAKGTSMRSMEKAKDT